MLFIGIIVLLVDYLLNIGVTSPMLYFEMLKQRGISCQQLADASQPSSGYLRT